MWPQRASGERSCAIATQASGWNASGDEIRESRSGGWVAEMDGCVAGCAHPFEKSAPGFKGISIHGLMKVYLRQQFNPIPLEEARPDLGAKPGLRIIKPETRTCGRMDKCHPRGLREES